MTEGQEFRGRSTAEAAIAASEALGVTRSEVDFRVISETGEGLDRVVVIQAKAKEGAKPRSDDAADASDEQRSEGRRERGNRDRGGRGRDRRAHGQRRPQDGRGHRQKHLRGDHPGDPRDRLGSDVPLRSGGQIHLEEERLPRVRRGSADRRERNAVHRPRLERTAYHRQRDPILPGVRLDRDQRRHRREDRRGRGRGAAADSLRLIRFNAPRSLLDARGAKPRRTGKDRAHAKPC